MKVKSESEVARSCPTLCDPMDCGPPGSSVHGIFQARVLERVAIAFSDVTIWLKQLLMGLPQCLVKGLPANAGALGSVPDLGRSHMP